ncbi:DNA repair protein [Lentinus tigrinus ALCF2SS1-7]|uniref:DNA repair protein REV1 n=1 Tax=Lentinus tigrinus ALCF2SS1-6 TaxID=1328759 RepID=A0A5C2RX94_9APHY|nr:DNA repair protein [Lentinus tigrinus ALCF2SS1-6]RPD69081.1 DNA repair protein [Lentinus tigrinus ALCF2SS1-7]
MPRLTQESSHSSDYFDDDPEFLKAIAEIQLPAIADEPELLSSAEPPRAQRPKPLEDEPPRTQKRLRSPEDDFEDDDGAHYHNVLNAVDANDDESLNSYTYGASRFGEFGEYMTRKRAKLQIQNAELEDDEDVQGGEAAPKSRIFQGLQIYINGWTEPSVQDLRKMIVQHGGIFHPYLDKKSLVTHIITCSLTPAKIREFKHMKVVRPEWLVKSIDAGTLLPWQEYIFRPGERVEDTQGRKVAQKSLSSTFVSQAPRANLSKPVPERPDTPMQVDEADLDPAAQHVAGLSKPPVYTIVSPPRTPKKQTVLSPLKSGPTTPSRHLYITDPSTPEEADRIPGYAALKSNPHAERAMADPAWRAAHTSVAPDFIEGYYKNSRLHHLSTWKAELKNLVAEAQERAENGGVDAWQKMASEIGAGAEGEASASASQTAVNRIVQENLGGRGLGSGDVSMRGAKLVKRAPGNAKGKGKEKEKAADEERVIMHCDFDSFFVSAGLIDRPHLRGKPVVVCHSQGGTGGGSSTSEIASASYEARKFGIKGGMSLQQARKLCPTVLTIPYEFQRYKQFSLQFYTILMAHADDLQAVSVDEALIDVTSSVARIRTELAERLESSDDPSDPAKDFAESIRAQVKKVTGCEVSIGIAHNIMLSRLASRRAKPAGSYHLRAEDVAEFLAPLDIDDLHGFGYSARQKAAEKLGTTNLGELTKKSKATLCDSLGKGSGETLYKALRGVDERQLESDKPRKSVSCDINYGIRFKNNEQAETFVYQMAEEVSRRLKSIDMRGRSLTLKILVRDPSAPVEAPKFLGHGVCEAYNKQTPLIAPGGRATSDEKVIGEHAWRLLKSFNFDPKELRGIGIQIQKLEKASGPQETELGQAVLPFKRVEADMVAPPRIDVQPPSQEDDIEIIEKPVPADPVDLPSFSQVDMSVFDALPEDLRKELEAEFSKRRSVTPQAGPAPKEPSPVPEAGPSKKLLVRGVNVKRITQQLAPRNRPLVSPSKNLFAKRVYASSVNVTERELRKYGIDPEVFAALPREVQREQLAAHRTPGVTLYTGPGERKVLKPTAYRGKRSSKSPGFVFRPPPAPKAVFVERPTLKQQGKEKGEKLCFSETEDVQGVIEAWVEAFRESAPNARDVEYFAKFLVQSVDGARASDAGVERAVAVVKWWLVLLRRYFGAWEHEQQQQQPGERPGRITSEYVGRAWWRAFKEVKEKMDVAARKKFGGCLSLK